MQEHTTPLLYAVEKKNMSMTKLLVESGANPNLAGEGSSCLPLDVAFKSGSRGVIDYLKSKGAKTGVSC